jgi:hypothetical protein
MSSNWDTFPYRLFLHDSNDPLETDWIVVRSMADALETVTRLGLPRELALKTGALRGGGSGYEFAVWLTSQWRAARREGRPKVHLLVSDKDSREKLRVFLARAFPES